MGLLDEIQSPADVKALPPEELEQLCREIREYLVSALAKHGGHLASNLGVVELTVAIHRVYDTSRDRLIFDVGHQCYTHKLLTGRKDFSRLRSLGGLSGFPKPYESIHDAFIAGHASNSVSIALGMARARSALGQDYDVVALIGDGALNGGMAYEGLSDAGHSGEPLVVILNDNGMSINEGVGGLAAMLERMRTRTEYIRLKKWYRKSSFARIPGLTNFLNRVKKWLKDRIIPENIFDDLGFEYIGPIDGHNIHKVENALRWAKEYGAPVLVHVITQKGRGFAPAEKAPAAYHGVGAYDPDTGVLQYTGEDFASAFGRALTDLAQEDETIVAITAAMKEGTGLIGFQETFPDRFFDVGIAEEHACAMAAGMAAQGLKPVFAVYSSFLQRGYDMLLHDVALMGLHVVFAVDRAGIVGRDGETHQGVFDLAFLSTVPGMKIYAPANFAELSGMLRQAVLEDTGPAAVRYPRGSDRGLFTENTSGQTTVSVFGDSQGCDVTIAVYGPMVNEALLAAQMLLRQKIRAQVIKLNILCPLDVERIARSVESSGTLLVAEEVCAHGCLGEQILAVLQQEGICVPRCRLLNLGDGILSQGDPDQLRRMKNLDGKSIRDAIWEMLHAGE